MSDETYRNVRISEEVAARLFVRDADGNRLSVEWGKMDEDGFYSPTISVHYDDNPLASALERLEALSPEAAYMAGCMLALWFATSPKASGVRVAEALFRFAMLGGHDDAKEQLAALAREETPYE